MPDEAQEEGVTEATFLVMADQVGEFIRDPENKERVAKLCKELTGKANEFRWDRQEFSLLLKGAWSRILWGIVKSPSDEPLNDLKFVFALGFIIGSKEVVVNEDST